MSDTALSEVSESATQAAGSTAPQPCKECLGSGGWHRYEPALDPAPGLLYLACVQCRGSGQMAFARA